MAERGTGDEVVSEGEKRRRVEAARVAAEAGETREVRAGEVGAGAGVAGAVAAELGRVGVEVAGYAVLREVSRGGQAVVFLAVQESTGRKVALKVMREGPLADERARERFAREARVLAALDHPGVVGVLDTGECADGSRFIAMDYVAGQSLDEYMKGRAAGNGDAGELLRVFLGICDAVNAAHLRGIVHRDLKPSNIRIDERGEPHVLDFGLARTALDRFIRGGTEPVSVTGEFLGSLPWSSPEQAEGDPEKIDVRTDVYALGVILYQMVTGGRFPYTVVGNIRDVLNNILTAEPTPPSEAVAAEEARAAHAGRRAVRRHAVEVNETIERIVLKALAKRRGDRYQNAGELARDIGNYLSGLPTSAGAGGGRRRGFGWKVAWPRAADVRGVVRVTVMPGSWKRTAVRAVVAGAVTAAACGGWYFVRYRAEVRELEGVRERAGAMATLRAEDRAAGGGKK